jgi:PncC family amidohydrolase
VAARVQALALAKRLSLATAESCTGGLLGHLVTEVPGSSAYYLGGLVSYSNAVKMEGLGVPATTIEHHGAVSAQVARAMAEGVRERIGADIGVAVTGVAGPDGGTPAKPVGLTYVAVAGPGAGEAAIRRYVWRGDRSENKRRSARAALSLIIEAVEDSAYRSRPT